MKHQIPREYVFDDPSVDEHARDVREAFASIPPMELRSVTVFGSDTDVAFSTTVKPEAVLLGAVVNTADGSAPSTAPAIHWEPVAGGARVTATYGLDASTRYEMTLVVIGGPR